MSAWTDSGLAGFKHGYARRGKKTPEYKTWEAMKTRCLNPKAQNYSRYGAIGVRVCKDWINSFPSFLASVGEKPTPKHSLDRINPNGDYEPGNCKWSTAIEQRHNRRTL